MTPLVAYRRIDGMATEIVLIPELALEPRFIAPIIGNDNASTIAMIEMTTSISTSVKPARVVFAEWFMAVCLTV